MEEDSEEGQGHSIARLPLGSHPSHLRLQGLGLLLLGLALVPSAFAGPTLDRIRSTGLLRYGCDMEGGGPFAYIDPADPNRIIGFEVELMDEIARAIGANARLEQGQWDQLLLLLASGESDLVINGYELTAPRVQDFRASRPYYILQMQLLARRDSPLRRWTDLGTRRSDGRRWLVGVLGGTSTETLLRSTYPDTVEIRAYTGATEAMLQASQGQIDATLQDLPAARFYRTHYPDLRDVGKPVGHGYYVIYTRKTDSDLAEQVDASIETLLQSGTLRQIYEKYNIWTDAQDELFRWNDLKTSVESDLRNEASTLARGWAVIWTHRDALLWAAAITIFLSVVSMPLAMAAGLLVALGRLYGPRPLALVLSGYVELIRGTPLMLQLYVLLYLVGLPPYVAGIAGLAINYSAYEAEIYRAGLQAIPIGQMEAALALGMSRWQALRRIIIPQAVRIVIPPVTNDFIALFKDSSVCSVVTIIELSKTYSILASSTGRYLEFAMACAFLYLVMSLPLSWLSRWSERKLRGLEPTGKGINA